MWQFAVRDKKGHANWTRESRKCPFFENKHYTTEIDMYQSPWIVTLLRIKFHYYNLSNVNDIYNSNKCSRAMLLLKL